jgi:hypothetical protein
LKRYWQKNIQKQSIWQIDSASNAKHQQVSPIMQNITSSYTNYKPTELLFDKK